MRGICKHQFVCKCIMHEPITKLSRPIIDTLFKDATSKIALALYLRVLNSMNKLYILK